VFLPQVDDKDLTNSHIFSVVYAPPEGAVYLNVNKTGMFYLSVN